MKNVALFPIPGAVSFPGTSFPLHVFEPRYRKMIHECIREKRWVGICNTKKEISTVQRASSLQEQLSSNSHTYLPYKVFSAGPCELLKTLDDGRLHVAVHLESRVEKIQDVQNLPYIVSQCEIYEDGDSSRPMADLHQQMEKILQLLRSLTKGDEKSNNYFSSGVWERVTPADFSFQLFEWIRFEPELMQNLLELQEADERLDIIEDVLSSQVQII